MARKRPEKINLEAHIIVFYGLVAWKFHTLANVLNSDPEVAAPGVVFEEHDALGPSPSARFTNSN